MKRHVVPLRKRGSSSRFPEPQILRTDGSGIPTIAAFFEVEDRHRMTAVLPCPNCSRLNESGRRRQIVVHRHGIPAAQHARLKAGNFRSQPDNLRVAHCPTDVKSRTGCGSYRFEVIGEWQVPHE